MKSLKNMSFLLAIVAALNATVGAQDRPGKVKDQIRQFRINRSLLFNYDFYSFAADDRDSSEFVAVVYFVNDLLQFVKKSDILYSANFELTFSIMDAAKEMVVEKTFRRGFSVDNYAETNSETSTHSYYASFVLTPGKYEILLELTDLDTRKSLRRRKSFDIASFKDMPLIVSNPIVSTVIKRGSSSRPERLTKKVSSQIDGIPEDMFLLSPFVIGKLNHYQIKNKLTVYHEFYGPPEPDTLTISYRLLNGRNEAVWKDIDKIYTASNWRMKKQIQLDPMDHLPGLYRLEIFARNLYAQKLSEVPIYFNRNVTISDSDSLKLDEVGPLQYIVNQEEFDYLSTLEPDSSDSAMTVFWSSRDPDPKTEENELRMEFMDRVRFATRNFISLIEGRRGWQTDQGKAYILYGPPSEVYHPQADEDVFQHEIWLYDNPQLKMRIVFVFRPEKGEYEVLSKG